MRLIDADALKKNFCKTECARTQCKDCIIDYYIEHLASPIDAEPVVRCKNCKWWKTNYSWNGNEHKICVREPYEPLRNAEDFCSYGERRKDNETD